MTVAETPSYSNLSEPTMGFEKWTPPTAGKVSLQREELCLHVRWKKYHFRRRGVFVRVSTLLLVVSRGNVWWGKWGRWGRWGRWGKWGRWGVGEAGGIYVDSYGVCEMCGEWVLYAGCMLGRYQTFIFKVISLR